MEAPCERGTVFETKAARIPTSYESEIERWAQHRPNIIKCLILVAYALSSKQIQAG